MKLWNIGFALVFTGFFGILVVAVLAAIKYIPWGTLDLLPRLGILAAMVLAAGMAVQLFLVILETLGEIGQ
jgi:preprotein translocase subunit SecD